MSRGAPPAQPMPGWPALMTIELALLYTQLGQDSFRLVARKNGVQPTELGVAVTRYRKADLDRMIDSLPARGAEMPDAPTANDPSAPDEADLALERARRRARG